MAHQLHRADLNAGLVLVFRRRDCPNPAVQLNLHGLNPETRYRVTLVGEDRKMTEQVLPRKTWLSAWEARLPRKGESLLMRYRQE